MHTDTLLVTGIHREELTFGDHVAALFDTDTIDIMRIPQGIPQTRSGTRNPFYCDTQHREIYLQLRQQIKGRYRLLIDLHCGINESGRCADIFCHDKPFLACLSKQPAIAGAVPAVRLINIVESNAHTHENDRGEIAAADAYTRIPREVWSDDNCIYVGIEIYLPQDNDGTEEDWHFSRTLIDNIRVCTHDD